MSSATPGESTDDLRRRAVIRHAVIWPGLALLATAAAFCAWSVTITLITSGLALACAVFLHRRRRGAGHAFVFGQVLLLGGSAILLLTAVAISDPVFPVIAAVLEAFTKRFFSRMGEFVFLYAILWAIVMACVLASQRKR